jgi:AcrR family transcriptional regulator
MTTTDPTGDQSPADHVSLSLTLLWGTRERRTRGPKPALTLDQIVSAAIAIADIDGLDALSMRRVARELRVGTMSLYRYVPGKGELLDLMLDAVSDPGKEVAQSQGRGWRGMLEVVARCARDRYLAHPWLLQVNWSRPVVGPSTLAGLEFVLGGLAGLGLTDQERVTAVITIDGFVTGVTRSQLQHAAAVEATGVSDEEFWGRHYPVLEKAMASGDYPAMAALAEDAFNLGRDETFGWGLQRVLDGIEALVDARSR